MSDTGPMPASAVREALRGRYGQNLDDQRRTEEWVCLDEARAGASWSGNRGQCDFLAINTWSSRGMRLIGHEIKVSKSDWKTELAKPDKAELFARHCHCWYVVMPGALAKDVMHEIPTNWGLLSVSDSGRVAEAVKPTAERNPEPVPATWWLGWLAQIDRQHRRAVTREVERRAAAAVRDATAEAERRAGTRRTINEDRAAELAAKVEELRRVTGIDLRHSWGHDMKDLERLWKLRGSMPPGLSQMLRDAAMAVDVLSDSRVTA